MHQNSLGGQRRNLLATSRESLFLAVFILSPVVGLIAGPSYAPLMFGLAGLSVVLMVAERRTWPRPDAAIGVIALLFLAICGAGLAGSILPAVTKARLPQMAGIAVGSLLLLTLELSPERTRRLIHIMFWMVAAGVAIFGLDTALDYPLQHLLVGPAANIGTKYNRGIISLVLLAWPIAAHLMAMGERGKAQLLGAIVLLAALVGLSSTGQVALVVGFVVWLAALRAFRVTGITLGAGLTGVALSLPLLMRVVSGQRPRLVGLVKWTGIHRLEIWDYMSLRILERPLSGWGLGAAIGVPVRPEELATYTYADGTGIYPHNQWIELWLETGFPGVVLAVVLVLLILTRIRGQWRAYALGALASALAVTMLNFEITTDSWWAALAACALLFRLLPREEAAEG